MHHIAVSVAEDLDLDVPRGCDIFLDEHPVIAERSLGLPPRRGKRRREIGLDVDLAHALAAAAGASLDQHRKPDLVCLAGKHHQVLRLAVIARNNRHIGLFHQRLRRVLQPHGADRLGRRPDEDQPGLFDLLDEIRIFREESVTWVDRIGSGAPGRIQDRVDLEIALRRRGAADQHRLIGHLDMQRACIGFGIDRDRGNAHFPRRANDPAGNLAPVGDEDFAEHHYRPLDFRNAWRWKAIASGASSCTR
jgi:hypothetical protein